MQLVRPQLRPWFPSCPISFATLLLHLPSVVPISHTNSTSVVTMGALLSIPLLGGASSLVAGAGLSCLGGLLGSCTGRAAAGFCKSCNCNSSVATRIGYSLILLVNSMLSWLMLSDWAIKRLQNWSYNYLKLDCKEGTCYGVLAVHRINFALGLFHLILAGLLVGVNNTKTRRAAIQNG